MHGRRTTCATYPIPFCLRWLHRTQYGLGRRSIQTVGANAYPTATVQTALLIRQIGGPRASRLLLCVMPAERTLMHAQMRHCVSPRSCSWHPPWTNEICDLSAPARKIFSAGLPPRTPPGMNSHLSTAVHTWKTHRIWATCLGDPGPLADAHDVGRDPPCGGLRGRAPAEIPAKHRHSLPSSNSAQSRPARAPVRPPKFPSRCTPPEHPPTSPPQAGAAVEVETCAARPPRLNGRFRRVDR